MNKTAPALREDLALIAELISENSRILDIGCGDGALLDWLAANKQVDGRGIDLQQENVSECLARGLYVIQGNAEEDICYYPEKAFNYVVLSKALQMMQHPKEMLLHMARISERFIVSIPNFGYWRNRFQLMFGGRMPVTQHISYEWYETPNIHFSTIRDFIVLCEELGFVIEQRASVNFDGSVSRFRDYGRLANLFSPQGVFLIREK